MDASRETRLVRSTSPLPRSNFVRPWPASPELYSPAITGALIGASALTSTVAVGAPLDEVPRIAGGPPDPSNNGGVPSLPERFSSFARHGRDAGDFYCEHAFFVAQGQAESEGSTVAKNEHGERLVGFLHVPRDAWTGAMSQGSHSQTERHERTRQIVGTAISGYLDAAAHALDTDEPFRMLLTGFGPFSGTHDNPTQSFVVHPENLDAAMQLGFGAQLLTPFGYRSGESDSRAVTEYIVLLGGEERRVQIYTRVLPVSDEALDPAAPTSLPAAIIEHEPHAVLSMGVRPVTAYELEFHADDGGLNWGGAAPAAHDASKRASFSLPPNYSLARALGAQAGPTVRR